MSGISRIIYTDLCHATASTFGEWPCRETCCTIFFQRIIWICFSFRLCVLGFVWAGRPAIVCNSIRFLFYVKLFGRSTKWNKLIVLNKLFFSWFGMCYSPNSGCFAAVPVSTSRILHRWARCSRRALLQDFVLWCQFVLRKHKKARNAVRICRRSTVCNARNALT